MAGGRGTRRSARWGAEYAEYVAGARTSVMGRAERGWVAHSRVRARHARHTQMFGCRGPQMSEAVTSGDAGADVVAVMRSFANTHDLRREAESSCRQSLRSA